MLIQDAACVRANEIAIDLIVASLPYSEKSNSYEVLSISSGTDSGSNLERLTTFEMEMTHEGDIVFVGRERTVGVVAQEGGSVGVFSLVTD